MPANVEGPDRVQNFKKPPNFGRSESNTHARKSFVLSKNGDCKCLIFLASGAKGRPFQSARAYHTSPKQLKQGSEQESDGTRILGCFLEIHKFGPSGGHSLSLQEQVTEILVAAAAAEQ